MIIVGAGRVGQALETRAAMRGVPCVLVSRREGWEEIRPNGSGPILLATRNDDLVDVMARIPPERWPDVTLVQNGMLRPWIAEQSLPQVTRGLLFFAVAARGDDLVPGGLSPFTGPRASAVVQWLQRIDVPAEVVDETSFRGTELEKLIWNCAFGLMCERYDVSVGTVVVHHQEELRALVAEMNAVGGGALGVQHDLSALVERLCDYSRSIASYRGAVKEWAWRNGWFVSLCHEGATPMPVHDRLLQAIGR